MVHFVRLWTARLLISGFHMLLDFLHLEIVPRVNFFVFVVMSNLKVTDELILDCYSEYRQISNLFEIAKCLRRLVIISTKAKWYRNCLTNFMQCQLVAASS